MFYATGRRSAVIVRACMSPPDKQYLCVCPSALCCTTSEGFEFGGCISLASQRQMKQMSFNLMDGPMNSFGFVLFVRFSSVSGGYCTVISTQHTQNIRYCIHTERDPCTHTDQCALLSVRGPVSVCHQWEIAHSTVCIDHLLFTVLTMIRLH